jgi:hypothetical protein
VQDRAGAYAEGIRTGAPQAIQVADGFHLWKNLCEAAGKTVAAHHHCLCTAAVAQARAGRAGASRARATARGRRRRSGALERTRARYVEVHERPDRGLSRAAVSRELNLDIQAVRRFANATCAEELLRCRAEQCLRPVDRPGWVYLPGDHLESQAMTGVGAPAGKVQPDAHRSPWRRFRP